MALFRKFFYRKPLDGLLEISERVYVFDYCFKTVVMGEGEYRLYSGGIVSQLRAQFPEASFMVFNFQEGEHQSQIDDILAEYGMTVMDYPRHYEGCPLLTMEMIHHFLRLSENWLSLCHQNVLLMHCERGGWPVLAFMLAGLLIYRKQFTGEQRTLEMIYKQAPHEILQLLSPLNPLPSQLRYLHYISKRNIRSKWPPLDRALTLDCVMLRTLPNFDGEGGCRPMFCIYGHDPSISYDRTSKILFSTQKKSRSVRHYRQADCELVKIDIHCHVQGDVVLECISLDEDLVREEMMFRVMFNTAFIRSNILMLNCDEVDILWDAKNRFPKDFRAEILFSEMDGAASLVTVELANSKVKEDLSVETFAKVEEIFHTIDWFDGKKGDAALRVLHKQLTSSHLLQHKLDSVSPRKVEPKLLQKSSHHSLEGKVKSDEEANEKITKLSDLDSKNQNAAHMQPKLYQGMAKSRLKQISCVNSLQSSPIHVSRYHSSAPSALGITALLQDHASFGSSEVAHSVKMSPSASSVATVTTSGLFKPASPNASPHMTDVSKIVSILTRQPQSSPLPPPPPPPHRLLMTQVISTSQSSIPTPVTVVRDTPKQSEPESSHYPTVTLVKPAPPAPPPPPSFSSVSTHSPLSPPTQELPSSNPSVVAGPAPPPPSSRQGPLSVGVSLNPNTNSHVLTSPPSPTKGSSAPPPPPPPLRSGPKSSSPAPPPSPLLKNSGVSPIQKPSNVPSMLPPHDSFKGSNAPSHPPNMINGPSSALPGVKGHNFRRTGSRLSTQSSARIASLKPLHWVKVTSATKGSLWAETQKSDEALMTPEFDMSELESLFSAVVPNSDCRGTTDKSSRRSSLGKKPDIVQLIDLRRANNCEIMLTKVKMSIADLMSSLLALDGSVLDGDQVDNLIKFCPTNEEMDLLKGLGEEKEKLGKCEQYFLELMKVPRAKSKLRVFSFKIQFCSQVADLTGNLKSVNSSAEEIRNSAKLTKVMQTILSLGNALNQGTVRGSAIGFRLDSLLKLTDARARNNKMTLMHYLCKVLADKLPELLDFYKDLVSLEAASKIQLKMLAKEMQAISKGLEKVEEELAVSENDGPISDTFHKTLKVFLVGAETEVRALTSLYSNAGRNADALALYFGEDPARCPFEQVISTLHNFVRMFIRAHKENCKQMELEKRKAQREAENEKMKLTAQRKEPDSLSPIRI